jgi:hypothetical protein
MKMLALPISLFILERPIKPILSSLEKIVKNFFMKVWHYYFAARYFIYAIEWAAARS